MRFRRWSRRLNLWMGLGLVLGLALMSVAAPWVTDRDPQEPDFDVFEAVPPGHADHPWGTDDNGFDLQARLLYGGRLTLLTALAAVALAVGVGLPLGAVSGWAGGRLDALLTGIMNLMLAFPALLTAICIVSALGKSLGNLLVAVALVEIPRIARQARSAFRVESGKDYLLASRALGASRPRQIFRVLLPNCLAPVIVVASMGLAGAVLEVAGLSYLGLGPEPGTAEWGLMVAESQHLLEVAPWAVIIPGSALALVVLGFNLVGDGLQDLLNVKVTR